MAYYPNIGSYGASYSWEFEAGTFVSRNSVMDSNIYVNSGIELTPSLKPSYQVVPAISSVGVTPTQAQLIFLQAVTAFEANRHNSLLSISPLVYYRYSHLYGMPSMLSVFREVQGHTAGLDVVYTNGYTVIYK
jgi:hypothetical protein